MASEDVSRLLDELSSSAETLHQETETIGVVIEGVEKRLREMDLGIETWLLDRPLWSREMSVSASSVAPRLEMHLGFAPQRGTRAPSPSDWCLQLREAEVVPSAGVTPGSEDSGSVLGRVHQQVELTRANPQDQVAALKLLPKILERLVELAKSRIDTIRDAKKLI